MFFDCSVWNKGAVETCRLLNGVILANGSCVNVGENPEFGTNTSGILSPEPESRVMPSVEYFQYTRTLNAVVQSFILLV